MAASPEFITNRANEFFIDDLNIKMLQQQNEKSPTSFGNNNSVLGEKASAISGGTNCTPNIFSDSTKQSTDNKKEIGSRLHAVSQVNI